MGVMRFIVHPTTAVAPDAAPPAYMSGFDGRIFPTRIEMDGNELVCRRHVGESGKLQVLWNVEGAGPVVLTTASLMERNEPYLLALELARGTLSDLRNQTSTWEVAGLQVPDTFHAPYRDAHRLFRSAVTSQNDPATCSTAAWESLAYTLRAGQILTQSYNLQRLRFRQSRSQVLPVSLGCDTGATLMESADAERFAGTFNSATVPIEWRGVEPTEGTYNWEPYDALVDWCNDNRLFVVAGPLLDLSEHGLPQWLSTWRQDFLNLQSFVCDFVETAVTRYVGRVRHWEISTRANTGGALGLSEENRLSLAARTLEVARQVDDEIQLSLRIGQPFGEYMGDGSQRLSPLQFVDALARSGIGLSEAHLEIEFGLGTDFTLPRHVLQLSRLIDQWSCLALPLNITLAFAPALQDEALQVEMLDRVVPLLMSKEAIVGIYWGCFRDKPESRFAGSGLLRADGSERPAFTRLQEYRSQYWRSDQPAGL